MSHTKSHSSDGRSPFGDTLLRLRTRRGFTQEMLARATQGDRISPRSITNYERKANTPQEWVLPHRPALRLLANALELDMVDQHALAVAWSNSKKLRDASPTVVSQPDFVTAGREDALRVVMDAWSKSVAGTPQIVFLEGIAGIGKTSLARHISNEIASSEREVMISWGAASRWASEIEPYLSVRSATDRILIEPEISSTLPGRYSSRPKLGSREFSYVIESTPLLARALISEGTLRELSARQNPEHAAEVEALLAVRSSAESSGRMVEYTKLLTKLSGSWPIVMVLEDLHWAGKQAASLLMYLAKHLEQVRDTPILIIGTYRNEEIHTSDDDTVHPIRDLLDSVESSPHVKVVKLNKLMSPDSGMAFVEGMITQSGAVSRESTNDLAAWLYEQTSGHPLLTSEMLRHLGQTGALANEDWNADTAGISRNVPAEISLFIDRRLSQTSKSARRILEIASSMNDLVLIEIIAQIIEEDEDEILEIIEHELVSVHQLLLPGNPITLKRQTRSTYRFPHALYRDHIYSKLSPTRRKRVHFAIGQAMEQRYDDPDENTLSEITSHYIRAEEWHHAQITGFRLAQQAVINLDLDLAEVWFDQAEDLAIRATDPEQLWRARAARLAVLRSAGNYPQAIELGERILKLADIHNWPSTLALTNHHLGEVYFDLGKVDRAVEYLQRAIALHLQENSLDLAAAGEAMISHATYRQGKYDVAREHARTALKLSAELQNSWVKPEAVLAAANCELDLGYYDESIENYRVAGELATMIGKLQNQFIPAANIGLARVLMGDYEKAIDELTLLIQKMETLNLKRLSAHVRHYLGMALEGAGQWSEAGESYVSAAAIRRGDVPSPTLYDCVAGQLRVALHFRQDDLVRSFLHELTEYLDEHGPEGIEYPLNVMVSVAQANAYLGDKVQYRRHIMDAYTLLMARAEMIADMDARTSYLNNVPASVEVQRLHCDLQAAARKQ